MTADSTSAHEAARRDGSALERGVRRYPLDLVCLHSDECRTLMTKGHHDADEFLRACAEWNGMPIKGWGRVRHTCVRPALRCPAKHQRNMHAAARGAPHPSHCQAAHLVANVKATPMLVSRHSM